MENRQICFEWDRLERAAREHFYGALSLKRPLSGSAARTAEEGERSRAAFLGKPQVRALTVSFDGRRLRGETLLLGETEFRCRAFQLLPPGAVRRGYAYLLTAGEPENALEGGRLPGERSLLDQFYVDAWGTALVDAGRDLLREELQRWEEGRGQGDFSVSDSFGPGYYGMELSQTRRFFQVLDGSAIGVEWRGAGGMWPPKSCAGFCLVLEPGCRLPGEACRSCKGSNRGCAYCRNGR